MNRMFDSIPSQEPREEQRPSIALLNNGRVPAVHYTRRRLMERGREAYEISLAQQVESILRSLHQEDELNDPKKRKTHRKRIFPTGRSKQKIMFRSSTQRITPHAQRQRVFADFGTRSVQESDVNCPAVAAERLPQQARLAH